jgi:hypothetical protein
MKEKSDKKKRKFQSSDWKKIVDIYSYSQKNEGGSRKIISVKRTYCHIGTLIKALEKVIQASLNLESYVPRSDRAPN